MFHKINVSYLKALIEYFLDINNGDRHRDLGPPKWHLARRHFVAALALLGFANIYAMRANLSVAIVEMTTGTNKEINGTNVHVSLYGK
ncbi:hypothetical protein OESDEN_03323 [Oesophagostomum dentatum]|uniref:Uncharacterized protein n=1 Tax=Oesophagostomum dentatum TaxID=61180 RepID=A0A0B1TGR0_OESDE|nr:hypothetical protein OESDEN_03323 [Oesophagostomum dentatum]